MCASRKPHRNCAQHLIRDRRTHTLEYIGHHDLALVALASTVRTDDPPSHILSEIFLPRTPTSRTQQLFSLRSLRESCKGRRKLEPTRCYARDHGVPIRLYLVYSVVSRIGTPKQEHAYTTVCRPFHLCYNSFSPFCPHDGVTILSCHVSLRPPKR
jgi:hypothetical protein